MDTPNMPRFQPCPQGHGLKKRKKKTLGGAYYGCGICGNFFVKAGNIAKGVYV